MSTATATPETPAPETKKTRESKEKKAYRKMLDTLESRDKALEIAAAEIVKERATIVRSIASTKELLGEVAPEVEAGKLRVTGKLEDGQ